MTVTCYRGTPSQQNGLGELDPRDDGFARLLGRWTRRVGFRPMIRWRGRPAAPVRSRPRYGARRAPCGRQPGVRRRPWACGVTGTSSPPGRQRSVSRRRAGSACFTALRSRVTGELSRGR